MAETKLGPTSRMKIKDKSSEQRLGHVNARNRSSYMNIIFNKLVTQ